MDLKAVTPLVGFAAALFGAVIFVGSLLWASRADMDAHRAGRHASSAAADDVDKLDERLRRVEIGIDELICRARDDLWLGGRCQRPKGLKAAVPPAAQ